MPSIPSFSNSYLGNTEILILKVICQEKGDMKAQCCLESNLGMVLPHTCTLKTFDKTNFIGNMDADASIQSQNLQFFLESGSGLLHQV